MKVKIEMTEGQAWIVNEALDLYSRIWMGQIDEPFQMLRGFCDRYPKTEEDSEGVDLALALLSKIYFPELQGGGYHSIGSCKTDERAKIAYDVQQSIRNKVAWANKPDGGYGVDFHSPLKTSRTEEFPTVVVEP